jgi:hypothetical protein
MSTIHAPQAMISGYYLSTLYERFVSIVRKIFTFGVPSEILLLYISLTSTAIVRLVRLESSSIKYSINWEPKTVTNVLHE